MQKKIENFSIFFLKNSCFFENMYDIMTFACVEKFVLVKNIAAC